jgi:hypothetical protein
MQLRSLDSGRIDLAELTAGKLLLYGFAGGIGDARGRHARSLDRRLWCLG